VWLDCVAPAGLDLLSPFQGFIDASVSVAPSALVGGGSFLSALRGSICCVAAKL